MNTQIGSYLIIRIAGDLQLYLAEVIQENPLQLKVTEDGPYGKLTFDDFIIDNKKSKLIQGTEEEQQKLFTEMVNRGKPLASGLSSIGIVDNKIRQILPA